MSVTSFSEVDFEPTLPPLMDEAPKVERFIQHCTPLLQRHALRTSDIAAILFHGEVRRMKDLAEQYQIIGYCMWDAGYTPVPTDAADPEWHWLEGAVAAQEDRHERQ